MSAGDDTFAAGAVARAWFGAVPPMARMTRYNNAVFRLRLPDATRILKMAKGTDGAAIRKELALIERLAAAGLPAPDVEHADPEGRIAGRPCFVMPSAGDRTVLDWASGREAGAEGLFSEMGTLLARVHGIAFEASGDLRDGGIVGHDLAGFMAALHAWADRLAQAGAITPAEAGAFRARALPDIEGTALCHGDFHAVHCIVRDGRVSALVDWESAWAGNPLVDLAMAHAYLDYYAQPRLVARFADGYAAVRPLDADFERAYLPVRMAHLIAFLRVWHAQGERAWRHAIERGRVASVIALYRRYAERLDG